MKHLSWILSLSLLSVIPLLAADVSESAMEADVLFCIGTPDARCAEFALVKEGYAAFPQKFPNEVFYEVGKSKPENHWAFLHPTKQDQSWAKGGETHPFTIQFHLDADMNEPTTFIIGYMGTHPDLSDILVTVNGTPLPSQKPTLVGYDQAVFNPKSVRGKAEANLFSLPAGILKKGVNTIVIVLEGKSWILYDYVALRKEAAPLALRERPQPNLAEQFRRGENAPMQNVNQILFAVRIDNHEHWYANFGYPIEDNTVHPYAGYDGSFHTERPPPGPKSNGKLGIYDLDTKEVRFLIDDEGGAVRDPVVHYNGRKVLFSYRPAETMHYHLYE
ncbi:MAG: hypothetical protein LBI05_01785, partial [Planctomycetaceae bacterium]|nr:hypothetical protein [Planctomycetaceae bacterium]